MISNEVKMRVAQNCPGYSCRHTYSLMSFVESSQSCSTCKNYIRGKCIKDLFDDVYGKIRVN
ncbi:hypothetical protein [Clostridium senegalense]|uniref:hypothetical protein n=1 Tax=Clostridium senegalense TaxID=1465809 RepID=UPI001C128D87|nr:hypothetical protein [Clostridium senegalense]MBU5228368.1 hypothetical protein [Clostridium senegalense]